MSRKTLKAHETMDTFTPKLSEHALAKWHEARERGYLTSPNGNSELAKIWARYCLAVHLPYVMVMGHSGAPVHVFIHFRDVAYIPGMATDTPEPRLTPEARAQLTDFVTPRLRNGGYINESFAGAFLQKDGHEVAAFALDLLRNPESWAMEPRFINVLANGNAAQLADSFRVYGVPLPEKLRQRMEDKG